MDTAATVIGGAILGASGLGDEAGPRTAHREYAGEFVGTGVEEMRCDLNSSVRRAEASPVQVTAPGGQVVLDATV